MEGKFNKEQLWKINEFIFCRGHLQAYQTLILPRLKAIICWTDVYKSLPASETGQLMAVLTSGYSNSFLHGVILALEGGPGLNLHRPLYVFHR